MGGAIPLIHNPTPKEVDADLGPVAQSDAMLLGALCQLTDPKVIVEFGFLKGHATRAMLDNVDTDARILTYEIEDRAQYETKDPRHLIVYDDMKNFNPSLLAGRKIDLVLFDASHVWKDSIGAWGKVWPHIRKGGLVVVHDTGGYKNYNPKFPIQTEWKGHIIACPDEHDFLDHLKGDGWSVVNLVCTSKIRHGIAVLQKEYDFRTIYG